MDSRTHHEQTTVNYRLNQMGLDPDDLREAVTAGELARQECTAHHPITYVGLRGWAETLKTLRDKLIVKGWVAREERGLELIVNEKHNIAIAVSSGNEGTGQEEGLLQSRYPKGRATKHVVNENLQLTFGVDILGSADAISKNTTWYLMVHRTPQELRYELSFPTGMGEDNHVNDFKERIIFEPINLQEVDFDISNEDPQINQEVIVDVKRKG